MNRKNIDEGKLRQLLSKYQNPDVTKQDIAATLRFCGGLTCKLEPFVFNDGNKMDLCNLQGTIPVTYKGNVYHIPVCIWLMDTHPNNAPMCYVKPTPDMHIKVSIYVDHNGKIYLPYLHDWVPNSSDLLGVIQVMTIMFGEQPPVYAKPKPSPQAVTNNAPYPTQSYMPQPSGSSNATPGPGYPPYPSQSTPYPAAGGQPYPAYPGYPPSSGAGGGFPPYPTFNSAGPGYPPYGNTPAAGAGAGAYPPYPPYPTGNAQAAAGAGGTITEEHIRASLLSAVEDKLRRRLREQLSQSQAELDTLGRIQLELMQGKTKLDSIIETLEKEQVELDKNITVLQDKEEELEKSIARLSEQQPIDVDEAVTTTAPLYKQLLNAFAEEAATEDAVYYMGEALRRGVIDLDVFLKQVRALSRRQFMLRALMHKCRQKAGLAG